jgi:hypothetical protein
MTLIKVFPGPCGFEATITATVDGEYRVRMSVDSKCPAVKAMAKELEVLTLNDIIGKEGFGRSRPFTAAAETLAHAACPVLTGFLKAAEVEMGLAVPRNVTMEFITEE